MSAIGPTVRAKRRSRPRKDKHSPPIGGSLATRKAPRPRSRLMMQTALALAGSLAYANAVGRPFMFDDVSAIIDNERIRQLDPTVFLPERERPVAGRPLVNLSFAINYALGGLNVAGYHIWNIALHLLCGLLLFAIVRDTLGLPRVPSTLGSRSTAIGFAVALIWMLHPLNSEAVTYVTQRTETMMACFYLLTLYAGLRAR
jgi:protein O-mannosyl-transferase